MTRAPCPHTSTRTAAGSDLRLPPPAVLLILNRPGRDAQAFDLPFGNRLVARQPRAGTGAAAHGAATGAVRKKLPSFASGEMARHIPVGTVHQLPAGSFRYCP